MNLIIEHYLSGLKTKPTKSGLVKRFEAIQLSTVAVWAPGTGVGLLEMVPSIYERGSRRFNPIYQSQQCYNGIAYSGVSKHY
jgi:hypothetical protein